LPPDDNELDDEIEVGSMDDELDEDWDFDEQDEETELDDEITPGRLTPCLPDDNVLDEEIELGSMEDELDLDDFDDLDEELAAFTMVSIGKQEARWFRFDGVVSCRDLLRSCWLSRFQG
jgi:hypothetical protein